MSTELQHSVAVLGLPLANVTADEAVERIEQLILSGGSHQVATANLDFWGNSLGDVDLHRILAGCSLVVADGMPLVWISRLLGKPLKERVSGVDLVPMLAELSARKGYGIYLLGGRPDVAARASETLKQMYPGVNIVGHHAPPVADLERMDHGDTLERIRAAKPDILLVAFGNPKQEKWIRMHSRRLGVPVSIGIGGSMDILIGAVKRAPSWMRRSGLEWLGRTIQEPGRLMPRYARNFGGLAVRLPGALLAGLLQSPRQSVSEVQRTEDRGVVHLHVRGKLGATVTATIDRTVTECVVNGNLLVVHLKKLTFAGPEGLGALLDARQRMLASGLSVTLAGVPLRFRILMSAWCLEPLFDEFRIPAKGFADADRTQEVRFARFSGKDPRIPAESES
ncbi:WecB/TagA/CpsF family glycosyltransferase [Acidicapsa dinghuensis]|uniref:WecB/TagA/CpsF family glycosyltransferase n=1 Tax=Acidicapsa dinghuensis TaxID=2218256 RepID=A0ABW1EDH7_9BACT|nr:WecB/TagA/CpsF family glycosyltransferase [Acidicapsa dinghuensis]